MSIEPFNRLVKLSARAFYDDITTKGENQPKTGRSDNRGIAVVVLDALTRRAWVREEDLAKDLKLHSKQLRRTLRFFEEEKLVMRDHRRETAKGAKIHNAAVAAIADVQHPVRDGEEKIKMHTHSYCCLDYAQIYDVVRYRMHRMKKKLKDELESKNTIQEYICPNCGKRYNALDAARLVSMEDEYFHCESCNGELVAESDKLAAQELGDGDDNARKRRREKLKDMLQKMEVQLKPLVEQLNRVKDLPIPEFGSLQAWEARACAASRGAIGDSSTDDASKSSQGLGGTPMPFLGETKVEVAFSGVQAKDEDTKSDTANEPMKVLPPWMVTQRMNYMRDQRQELKQESKFEDGTSPAGLSDDKKRGFGKDDQRKNIQDEYLKAYYAALYQRQREQEEAVRTQQDSSIIHTSDGFAGKSSHREVGIKTKREEDVGDDDDYDDQWEEAAPPGNTGQNYKVNDLNVEADATADDDGGDDDGDDVEWEEG
ncbi:hypothetical protein Nepgr_012976 [Nepenthes gracilis]|uniref:HTH TFE/IIEalpha-type domain-containing protein n=1 Tax=Nepenthes gracilis TaxID=150966 RepID=A0AAD3SGN8_NEPGR|nr:hypothetical protein Nepgr_012976 [Nepenthes gracilis]